MGASNTFQLQGHLPEDKEKLSKALDRIISGANAQVS